MRLLTVLSMLSSTAVWANEPLTPELSGKALYLNAGGYGCAVCHGPVGDGAGQAGGYIRGATVEQLRQSLADIAPMQPLTALFSDEDLDALGNYLTSLALTPLINLTYTENGWNGNYEPWQPGQSVDVVLYNATFETKAVNLSSIGVSELELAPLERMAVQGKVTSLEKDLAHLAAHWEQP